jgi:hypothetical protein
LFDIDGFFVRSLYMGSYRGVHLVRIKLIRATITMLETQLSNYLEKRGRERTPLTGDLLLLSQDEGKSSTDAPLPKRLKVEYATDSCNASSMPQLTKEESQQPRAESEDKDERGEDESENESDEKDETGEEDDSENESDETIDSSDDEGQTAIPRTKDYDVAIAALKTWLPSSRGLDASPEYGRMPAAPPFWLIALRLAGLLSFVNHSDCDEGWSEGQCKDITDWLTQILSCIDQQTDNRKYFDEMLRLFSEAVTIHGFVKCS